MSKGQRLVVLEISWSEGSIPRAEMYGPWDVTDEEVHLADIRQFMNEWRQVHGDPDRAVLSMVREPASWRREQEEKARR